MGFFFSSWNDFQTNVSSSFRELRSAGDFFDVTLVCDGGEAEVRAHRVVLAACSPLFRKILAKKQEMQLHNVLYLKGVDSTNLSAVMDFMYHGEVNVAQDELAAFLKVAEDLCIKGLTDSNNKGKGQQQPEKRAVKRPPNPLLAAPAGLPPRGVVLPQVPLPPSVASAASKQLPARKKRKVASMEKQESQPKPEIKPEEASSNDSCSDLGGPKVPDFGGCEDEESGEFGFGHYVGHEDDEDEDGEDYGDGGGGGSGAGGLSQGEILPGSMDKGECERSWTFFH